MTKLEMMVVGKYCYQYAASNGLNELSIKGIEDVQKLIFNDFGESLSVTLIAAILAELGWNKGRNLVQTGPVFIRPTEQFLRAKTAINLETLHILLEKALAAKAEGASDELADKYIGAAIYVVAVMRGQDMNDEVVDGINAALG